MMKHTGMGKAFAALMAVGLALGAAACGGAPETNRTTGSTGADGGDRASKATASFFDSTKAITADEAFGTKSVWFAKGDADPDEDSVIDRIYVFDGEGGVTAYQASYDPPMGNGPVTTTYGDLLGLSESELIRLAKDRDEDCFENTLENYRSTSAKFFADKAEQDAADAGTITKKGEEFQKTLVKTTYEEPQAKPFYLKANSSEQYLGVSVRRFDEQWAQRYLEGGDGGVFVEENEDLSLKPIDTVRFDGMRIQGYDGIVTSVGPDNKGFTSVSP